MDIGPLVAVMRLDDAQFEQRMRQAVRTSDATAKAVQRALDGIDLTIDERRFADSLRGAERSSATAAGKIESSLRVQLGLDDSKFSTALRDAPTQAAKATQQIARAFSDVGQAADQSARRIDSSASQSARALAGAKDAAQPLLRSLGDVGSAADQAAAAVRRSADRSTEAMRDQESATREAAKAQADFERALAGIGSTLDRQTGAITDASRALVANKIPPEYLRNMEQAGVSTQQYISALLGAPSALAEMRRALGGNEAALANLARAQNAVETSQDNFMLRQRALGTVSTEAEDATRRAARTVDMAGQTSGQAAPLVGGLADSFDRARTSMLALLAGSTLIDFFRTAVERASDLNETVSKSQQIFGDSADQIDAWGKDAAKSLGISKAAALDAASNFGNMFQQLGFSSDAAADLSKKVVQMSADLGSFNNLPTEDVIDRISGALRGEYDSLQLLIPNINAARVEQEAMSETGKQSADALTAQEKAAAVLAIVHGDGAKAMGDFARTATGAANAQKTATAVYQESQAQIGEQLLPTWQRLIDLFQSVGVPAVEAIGSAFATLIDWLSPVISLFQDMPEPLQAAAIALGAVVLLNGPLVRMATGIGTFATRLRTATGAAATFGVAAKGALSFLGGPIGIAIIGITTALTLFSDSSDDAAEKTIDLSSAIDEQTGKWKQNAAAALSAQVESSGLGEAYRAIGGNAQDLVDAIAGVPAAQDRVNAKIAETQAAAKAAGVQVDSLGRVISSTSDSTSGMATSFNNTSEAANRNSTQFQNAAKSADLLQQFLGKVDEAQSNAERSTQNTSGALQRQAVEAQGLAGGLSGMSSVLASLTDDAGKAVDPVKWLGDMLDKVVERAKAMAENTEAQRNLNETESAAADASRALDIFSNAMDRASGRQVSLEEAAADWNDTIRTTASAWKDAADAGDLNWQALQDWNVAALTATKSGAGLYDALNAQYGSYKDSTAAAYSAAAATGDVAGAQEAARAKATELREAFINNNAEMLGGREQAAALADKLGILDGQTIDPKTFDVIAQDQQARDAVATAQQAVINNKNFLITADAATAQAQASTLNATLNEINGKQVRWFAIGNVTVAITQEQATSANNKAANFGYAPTDYGFPKADGGWIGLAGGGFSDGMSGWVRGPGGPTDDLVVAQGPNGKQVRVSSDEFVVRASQAVKFAGLLEAINAGTIKRAGGGWISRAGGGAVGSSSAGTGGAAQDVAAVVAGVPGMIPDADAIGEAWAKVGAAVQGTWESVMMPAFDELDARTIATGEGQVTLAAGFGKQWGAISTAVQVSRAAISAEHDILNAGSQGVADRTAQAGASVAGTWAGSAAAVQASVQGVMLPAMAASNQGAAGMQAAHEAAARGVIAAWGTIKAGVAEPVNWVLQNVWNQGVLPAWEQIRGWLPSIDVTMGPLAAVKFAKGGVFGSGGGTFPGYSPGNDTITAAYSPGEGVLVPEAVRGIGGPAGVQALNERFAGHRIGRSMGVGARDPKFFAGGVWDKVPSVSIGAPASDGKAEPAPADQLSFVKGFAFDAFDTITHLMRNSLAGTQAVAEGSPWGRANSNLAANTVGALLGTLKTMFGLENDGKGGNPVVPGSVTMDGVLLVSSEGKTYAVPKPEGPRGAAMEAVASQMGTSYVWGAAGPNVFDCSGLMSWALAQAGINRGRLTADGFDKAMPHVTVGKPGDMPTYSARYSRESGMAGHIGMILDPAQDLMMHTDGAGPARVQAGYKSREGGPLSIVDAIGGTVNPTGKGVGELPAILARAIYGDYSTAASAVGALDPARAGDLSAWESTRTLNTVDPIQDFGPMNMARGTLAQVGPIPPGDPVNRWAPMYASLLAMKGKPASALANILGQEKSESGGDPLAYNNTDRNFFAGHPSKSLLQTIPGTFRANAEPGFNTNIWHPPSNGLAAINYVDKKYGGVFPLRAYDSGGGWQSGTLGVNLSGATEEVLTGPERSAWVADVRQRKAEKLAAAQQQPAIVQRDRGRTAHMPLLNVERLELIRGTPADVVDEMLWRARG